MNYGAGTRPGFYTDALAAARILFPVSKERMRENQFIANSLLLRVQSWRAALWIVRDLRHFFDRVAISTAFHKLAKLAHKQRVIAAAPPSRVNQSQYLAFVKLNCALWLWAYLPSGWYVDCKCFLLPARSGLHRGVI